MDQHLLFEPIPEDKLAQLSKEELIVLLKGERSIRLQMLDMIEKANALNEELKQKTFLIEDQFITAKNKLFGRSSERSPKQSTEKSKGPKKVRARVQLPSERYPNAALIERDITFDTHPSCGCCGSEMSDSGMTEDSEYLTVIPKQYLIIRQKRHKYRCQKCHGDMKTAPGLMRVTPGSSYSDEMMIDVALAKYCDLIPIERYAAMAGREGIKGLPPQSLIETTHQLADYAKVAYRKLRTEILASRTLHADETRHRMLEGSKTANWHLWGFSTAETSYFEIHDTRSGDVALDVLTDPRSKCELLMSDVFSGYGKAVRESNERRKAQGKPLVRGGYCNAHSRRKFKEAAEKFPDESQFFIETYGKIYRLEKIAKARPPDRVLRVRRLMKPLFEAMRTKAMADVAGFSVHSSLGKAMSYFLKNYEGLTLFLAEAELAIDNNHQERLLRNPVVGRKTWYGTHSERGAETAAILFSLVESCKLNQVNPREYMKKLVADLHEGKPSFTPREFKAESSSAGNASSKAD